MSIELNPLLPTWLSLALMAILLMALVHGVLTMLRKHVAVKWAGILTALRLAMIVTFLLILLQPVVSYTSQDTEPAEILILVDVSQSMNQSARAGAGSRLDEMLATVTQGDFAASLKHRYHRNWFAFSSTAIPLDQDGLASLKADGSTTYFGESIEAAYKNVRAFGKNPRQLLLVSDGNDRSTTDPVAIACRLGLSIDVLAPSDAAQRDPSAIEIAEVQGARRVLLGSETHFRVTLQGKFPAPVDRPGILRVTEDGKNILDHAFAFKAGRSEQNILLKHRPDAVGVKRYEFQIVFADNKSNRAYPLAVQVVDDKYEVLILEDHWRWEYKYLHRLFEDDPSFRFTALLARGGGTFQQFASPDRRVNLIGYPQSRSDLEGFDTFILGDVNPSTWPRGLAQDLTRIIANDGKTLVVIAGPNLAKLLEFPDLHALLPVELKADSGNPVQGPVGPIEVRLRPDSADSPFFFQLQSGGTATLPPLDQIYPVLRKRAGATVLLEAVNHRNEYGPSIVIAEHTIGRGRVLFVGADTLWKWHTLASSSEGPTPYSIFWQQAFRAMTPARSKLGPVNLWLTANRSRMEVGRPVVVNAEVESSRPLPAGYLEASVSTADGKRMPLIFAPDPVNPHSFRTEFTCLAPGIQTVSASFHTAGKVLAQGSTVIQAHAIHGEQDDVGIDHANLARIAQDTGGNVIDPARPETWPSLAKESLPTTLRIHSLDLWNNASLLVVLCALLAFDWFLRLFRGLIAG